MKTIDVEAFKKSWLSFEEIEGIKRWLKDLEHWNIYDENTFYSNLEKKIFAKRNTHV
jgi:hypothetical protein